ncbi:unnamed protein product [Adineta ricciae]|uniref:DUF4590 domain-containing protein n=1 Tax=Adineta ricciae TaxID=249248 RepID=A0A815RAD7_ADIRI|nr:unnamed protein product [Adineta ricciae]
MMDRNQTRSGYTKKDYRLQAVITSPYVRPQLRHAGLINSHGQVVSQNAPICALSPRKRQRREDDTVTPESLLRALKNNENNRLSRYHRFEIASRRAAFDNFQLLDRRHRKQSTENEKLREKSAPTYAKKIDYKSEQQPRVTSAHVRKSRLEENTPEFDSERIGTNQPNQLDTNSTENRRCKITMSYGLKPINYSTRTIRHEIVIVQQHSTGDNTIVYRGFLAKGDSFSFQIQRRATSPLALVYYTKGLVHSLLNDCCEYHYSRQQCLPSEHDQFLVKRIQNVSSCEKCRSRYSRKILSPKSSNSTAINSVDNHSQQIRQYKLPSPSRFTNSAYKPPNESSNQQNSHLKEARRYIKNTQSKRQSMTTNSIYDYDRSESVDFHLLELALNNDRESYTEQTLSNSHASSTSTDDTVGHNPKSIQGKESPKSSNQNQDIQDWIIHTDASSLKTYRSTTNTNSTEDVETSRQTSKSISSQETPPPLQNSLPTNCHLIEKNVENFVYILDSTIEISDYDKIQLRGLINSGLIIDNTIDKSCIDYITDIVQEQIIMILSKTALENLPQHIRDLSQLHSIYIVDDGPKEAHNSLKLRGIHTNLGQVCRQLEIDLVSFTTNLTAISSVLSNDTNINKNLIYTQMLKDLILETDDTTDLQKDMLDFCREQYAGNEIQLKFIDEFEHDFRPQEAVRWYTRQKTFLFKMLFRAFRLPDPYILFKLRFYIQHLQHQMKSNLLSIPTTIYRAQYVSHNLYETLLKNNGGLMIFNTFLFAHKTKDTTEQQQQKSKSSSPESDVIFVLFQMKLDVQIPMIELQNNTEELLLPAATVFRISSVKKRDRTIPVIKLSVNADLFIITKEITKNIYATIHDSFLLLRIVKLMKHVKDIHNMEYVCDILSNHPLVIQDPKVNLTIGGLYHILCCYYYEEKQYDRALQQSQKSLQIYLRVLPPDDLKLTPAYNNMGSIYHKQGLDTEALDFHRKAYDIQVLSSNPDLDSIVAYAGNIASVLVKQGKYEEALPYLQRDLQIRQRLYPNGNDLELSTKYHNLAGAQFRLNQYYKALENYQKCLEIELKLHPSNHATVAVTYYSMATVLERLQRLPEAIEGTDEAIQRLLLTRDENDTDVRFYRDYKKHLQEKVQI